MQIKELDDNSVGHLSGSSGFCVYLTGVWLRDSFLSLGNICCKITFDIFEILAFKIR